MPETFAPYDEDIYDDVYEDEPDFMDEEIPDDDQDDGDITLSTYEKSLKKLMEEKPMSTEKPKRVFLVCRSKNCEEAKRARVRCTISMPEVGGSPEYTLTRRRFCTMYSTPEILETSNTPDWKISPDKPGERTLKRREKKAEQDFIQNNPDFLEIT